MSLRKTLIALGVVIGVVLRSEIRRNAVENARETATVTAQIGIQPFLTPADIETGLSESRIDALDPPSTSMRSSRMSR